MRPIVLGLLLLAARGLPQDTLGLASLQRAAVEHDPRARELALQEESAGLRLANLAAARLPAVTVGGQAMHQSEVPAIPITLPGVSVPVPPKDRYEATLDVEQLLYDSGVLGRRREAEEARLVEERAKVVAALYPLRSEVNAAFFQALAQQQRLAEIETLMADLGARLEEVRAQAHDGAALPGDTAAVRAELLTAEQNRDEAAAARRAALAQLSQLTGRSVADSDVLALPDLATEVERAVAGAAAHPQYAVFGAERAALEAQSEVLRAQTGPRLSAFGEWAYGRPGLAQFTDRFHDYWYAGVRVRWQPWNWRTTARERELLWVQGEIVNAEEAAFTAGLERQVQDELVTMERLAATLATDDRIVELREQVERQARAQLAERVITPAQYVTARTDLQDARLARQRHRVELARARAGYLTTLGAAPW
jgi:outer membrane protein TolC